MNTIRHVMVGGVFALASIIQPAGTAQTAQAQTPAPQIARHPSSLLDAWRKSPYSSGLIYARAARLGLIRPATRRAFAGGSTNLNCKNAPCVFPNVLAGAGTQPIDETPISANPQNPKELLTAGNDYNCSSLTGYFYSNDGGTTWTSSCGTLVKGASGGDGDPIVGFDLGGVAYRGGIDAEGSGGVVVVDTSTDGKSWSTPIVAVKPFFSGGLTDKPWLQIDIDPNSPRKNAIYVSTTQFDSAGQNSEISVSHSTDGGKTWKQTATGVQQKYPLINQFSDIATGKDGTVYVSFLRCTATGSTGDCGGTVASMMLVKSTDGGNTWSKATTISSVSLAPDSCGAFYGCLPNTGERLSNIPVIAVDKHAQSATLYEIQYSYAKYCKVEVLKSVNGGASWSKPVAVAPASDTNDQFFAWLSISAKGEVGATWLDRRNDPSNINYEMFGGYSGDGGNTYANAQIATVPSNPNNDGFGGSFMGDYTGNVFAASSLYASWTDTRTGNSQDVVGGLRP